MHGIGIVEDHVHVHENAAPACYDLSSNGCLRFIEH